MVSDEELELTEDLLRDALHTLENRPKVSRLGDLVALWQAKIVKK